MSQSNPPLKPNPAPTWRINGTPVGLIRGTQPAPTVGESGDFSLRFAPRPDDGPRGHIKRYEDVVALLEHKGDFDLYKPIVGTPKYRDHSPDGSILVSVEPPGGTLTGRGMWGLVAGGSDETVKPEQRCLVTLSVTKLVDREVFPLRRQAEQALRVTGV